MPAFGSSLDSTVTISARGPEFPRDHTLELFEPPDCTRAQIPVAWQHYRVGRHH